MWRGAGARTLPPTMRRLAHSPDGGWVPAIGLLAGLALASIFLLAAAGAGASASGAVATASASRACGDVVVKFKPEGSGGAHAIRATGISCSSARNIARSCVKGNVTRGWTATTWDGKVLLVKRAKRIRYTAVGGGGCGYQQKSCGDFGYRGVGFFGVQAVGISCGGAKTKARAWYDKGGSCSFGHSCKVAGYRCEANAKTGTVTCRRQNGFRFRWRMGE